MKVRKRKGADIDAACGQLRRAALAAGGTGTGRQGLTSHSRRLAGGIPSSARQAGGYVNGTVMATTGETSAQLALRDPDIRLMLRVRDDEPGAFEELVELYQHRLVAVMNHLVGNAAEAEDLAQEVFLRVYRARKKYRPARSSPPGCSPSPTTWP